MKLRIRQRLFSWFDSYDVYDEAGNTYFKVEGKLSFGHCLHILDSSGNHIATLQERVLTFLPKFEMYIGNSYVGRIVKEFTFFRPRFHIEGIGWSIDGEVFEWDYKVRDSVGGVVATVSKELFHMTDNYIIDVPCERDALTVLLVALAIDAEKCSRS